MIISHAYRFIFIKTLKTAGTSIEIFLSQHCGDADIVTPIYPHVEPHRARNHQGWFNPIPEILGGRDVHQAWLDFCQRKHFYNHIPAAVVRARVSRRIWRNYFKFCVERNPWDKTISHYWMLRHRAGGVLSWEDFFARRDFPVNYPLYADRGEALLVDRVVRYERLAEDLGAVFHELGVPWYGTLGVQAKGEYRTDRSHPAETLTTAQIEAVANIFAPEIRMHGYRVTD